MDRARRWRGERWALKPNGGWLQGPSLSRDPQWQDVVDNTVGVLIGLGLGWLVARLLRRGASSDHAPQ